MAWQNPRTAPPSKSIWLETPEEEFRTHLVELESKTNSIPMDPKIFSSSEWLQNNTSSRGIQKPEPYTLPLEIEQQVTDDFAFLAAVTEGAQSVAAVCLEERVSPPGITLRFATLDSLLDSSIKEGLSQICQILMEHASSTTSTSTSTSEEETSNPTLNLLFDTLFTKIISLHQTRLLARLRSSKWKKPTYLSKSHKSPLYKNFAILLHRTDFLYTKSERSLLSSTRTLITTLSSLYTVFEDLPSSNTPAALKEIIIASYTFLSSPYIKTFSSRLSTSYSAKKPTPQIASALKTLRQIEKIASYKRVCLSILEVSREYGALFREIGIEYLRPYEKVDTSMGYEEWARCMHVHAEVQLVVWYDLVASFSSIPTSTSTSSTTTPSSSHLQNGNEKREEKGYKRPRHIGTSKLLCYLCYHFLKAHRTFFPSRTHGRLYDQWTIPDLKEYDEEIVRRYRRIIKEMDEYVVHASEGEGEYWRLMPMTSVDSGPFEEVTGGDL